MEQLWYIKDIPFIFFYKKNDPSFIPQQKTGVDDINPLEASYSVATKYVSGTFESPAFGPARSWKSLHWRGASVDPILKDSVTIQVIGIALNGSETFIKAVSPATDTSLNFINAATYPYIKLKMINSDAAFATPNQLRYWRINAEYVPEGAVAPNVLYTMKDSVEQGDKIDFAVAKLQLSKMLRHVLAERRSGPRPGEWPLRLLVLDLVS